MWPDPKRLVIEPLWPTGTWRRWSSGTGRGNMGGRVSECDAMIQQLGQLRAAIVYFVLGEYPVLVTFTGTDQAIKSNVLTR